MKLGEAMYKAQQAETTAGPGEPGAGEGAGGGQGAATDGVVDAEFEEVDEDRKDKSA
ncbi:MAG: hypothetical protein WD711_01470 [Dongiaceae bacterium]